MTKELESPTTTGTTNQNKLVLYNDDVNPFEHVIACLIMICNHTHDQAEQCATIAHHKGKCVVKEGDIDTILGAHNLMGMNNLTTEII